MEEIKPCPFCGSHDPYFDEMITEDKTIYFMSCAECGAQGPIADEERQAGKEWNKRS